MDSNKFDYINHPNFASSTGPWSLGLEVREAVNLEDRDDDHKAEAAQLQQVLWS